MNDCYNRCLCAVCLNNDICPSGCSMCDPLKACRFIIARGKCANYTPDKQALTSQAAAPLQGGDKNANTDRSS